jgi:hypothetical protein
MASTDSEGWVDREPLEWWLDWINVLIGLTDDAYLRGAVPLDYSPASLQALEGVVRARYGNPLQTSGDDPFVSGVVAYLGETLMRMAGGAWGWTTDAPSDAGLDDPDLRRAMARHRWFISGADEPDVVGLPMVNADPALQLPALSPMYLLLQAIGSGEPDVWASAYRRWRQAVDDYAASHPGWAPAKEHTLVDGASTPPPSAVLDEWLARQRARFPDWVARHSGDWDFSVESLDRLAALVIELTPTVEAFDGPTNTNFVDGAVYYFGEMLRHRRPAEWVYREFRDEGDPETANFQIQRNDDTFFTSPYFVLRRMIRRSEPGHLRQRYHEDWISE